MVGIDSEVGEKKRLAARLIASAVRFDSDENSVNLCEGFRIFRLQNPALFGSVVFVKNAEVDRLLKVWAATTPRLKCLASSCCAAGQGRRRKRSETFPWCRTRDHRACGWHPFRRCHRPRRCRDSAPPLPRECHDHGPAIRPADSEPSPDLPAAASDPRPSIQGLWLARFQCSIAVSSEFTCC